MSASIFKKHHDAKANNLSKKCADDLKAHHFGETGKDNYETMYKDFYHHESKKAPKVDLMVRPRFF